MKERIESLEREVTHLRRQLRILWGILNKVQDSIDEVPSDFYMPLWDGRDGQEGQKLTDFMRSWRRGQRELQVTEAQLAYTKNKDSDEARYLAKQVESQRRSARLYEQYINRNARELIEANIMADHDWQLVRFVDRTKTFEFRDEACSNPKCGAVRQLTRILRDDEADIERVARSFPSPMMSCPYDVAAIHAIAAKHRASGDEDIPF